MYLSGRACLLLITVLLYSAVSAEQGTYPGDTRLTVRGDVSVGNRVSATIQVDLTQPLEAGDRLIIGQHWTDAVRLQVDEPGSDSFVRAANASLTAGYRPWKGIYGGLDSLADAVAFTVGQGGLVPGRLQIHIDRLVLPGTATDNFRLPVSIERSGRIRQLPGNALIIPPGEPADLNLAADSLVRPGDDINLRVELLDRYGNRSHGSSMTLDLLINGTFRQRVAVSSALQPISDVSFQVPGVYQVEVRTGGGGLRGLSNPVSVAEHNETLLWADIGLPSSASDGLQSAEALVSAAAAYDISLPSDHGDPTPAALVGTDGVRAGTRWSTAGAGGAVMRLAAQDGREVSVALAEQPADLTRILPGDLGLVQVAAGGSAYTWMGDRAAARGYRVGFIGTNHSHQYPADHPAVYTAIRQHQGQDWFEALARGQTFVAVGERIILDWTATLTDEAVRRPALTVISGDGIVSVQLVKNGEPMAELVGGEPDQELVALELFSENQPFSPVRARPRNAREWIGYLATRDARLEPLANERSAWKLRPGEGGSRLDFYTRTHGNTRLLPFYLKDMTSDSVIELSLAPVLEDAAWLPGDRLPQAIRAQRFIVSAEELKRGALRSMDVTGYTDSLRLRRLARQLPTQGRFSWEDTAVPRFGDYYYFIVRLISGAWAVTSPIYVVDHQAID